MRTRVVYSVIAVLMVMMALGCSNGNVGTTAGPDSSTRFVLNVDDGSFFNGSSIDGINLTEADYDDHVVVSVNAEGAQDLKALYFTLEYDETLYRPMRVESANTLADEENTLCLDLRTIPGKVVYGEIVANPDWREGFTGDSVIASVTFRKQACPVVRDVASAPTKAGSVAPLDIDTDTDLMTWYYYNLGDYNQDGLVTASDLTPIGQRYGNSNTPDKFPVATADSAADGNDNGLIEVGDITPIGQNYENNALGGYNIYEGVLADYPENATDDNGAATMVTNVEFSAMLGATATDRLRHEYTLAAPTEGAYYWVRPVQSSDSSEGIASNYVLYSTVPQATIAITNPPADGDGSNSTPWQANVTTDYTFTLTDPTDGDVTNDANTVYIVSNPAAGSIDTADATLNIENTFIGTFYVSATYNGLAADNQIWFEVAEAPEEDLWIMPDTTDADWASVPSGDGTEDDRYVVLSATFNSDGSLDFTLAANTMEDGSGDDIDVTTLTWDAEPPFIVTWDGTAVSTFQPHYDSGTGYSLCSGSLYAQDAEMNDSQNEIWVKSTNLP